MTLKNLLSQHGPSILERWLNLTLETYPGDSFAFLKKEKDRFQNPVGYTLSQETKALYGELLEDMDLDRLSASLDEIVKIRSVQDFSPSQATGFIFLLKQAIREALRSDIREQHVFEELLEFESRIDRLALLGLDVYTKWRDKVYEIRLEEVRTQREMAFKIMERSAMIYEKLEPEPGPEDEGA